MLARAVESMKTEGSLPKYVEGLLIKIVKSREPTVKWADWLEEKADQEMANSEEAPAKQEIEEPGLYKVSLTSRRACVIYLNEVLQLFGKTSSYIQERFVEV